MLAPDVWDATARVPAFAALQHDKWTAATAKDRSSRLDLTIQRFTM